MIDTLEKFIAVTEEDLIDHAKYLGIDLQILHTCIIDKCKSKSVYKWTEEEVVSILEESLYKSELKKLS